MKLLPFKLSEQENQSLKGTSKGKPFKFFQKEVVIYLILLVLAFVFFLRHHNIFVLFVVMMAGIIGLRYSQSLKSSKATYSIGEKVEKEIKEQQELTKKIALPIIFGMVGFFILFMVALVVYVFYLKPYLSPKPEVTSQPVGQEQTGQERELNYDDILSKMFPGKKLVQIKNRQDCSYDEGTSYLEGKYKHSDIYCVSDVREGFFTNPKVKTLLLSVRSGYSAISLDNTLSIGEVEYPERSHAEGLYHAILGVFSIKDRELLTEPLELVADHGRFDFYDCEEGTFILFTGTSAGQGWFATATHLLRVKNGRLERIWPEKKGWPWDYMTVEVEKDRLSLSDFMPEFSEPPSVFPTSGEFRQMYDLYWDKNTCRFEIKNWQTYQNEELGFEIKYPNSVEIKYTSSSPAITPSIISKVEFVFKEKCPCKGVQEYLRSEIDIPVKIIILSKDMELRVSIGSEVFDPILKDGYETRYELSERKLTGAILEKNQKIYDIKGRNSVLVNQMLSTFRFLE